MSADVVQIRWQLIRAAEQNIALQNENSELRKKITTLNNDLHKCGEKRNLRILQHRWMGWVERFKSVLRNIKVSYEEQISDMSREMSTKIIGLSLKFHEMYNKIKGEKEFFRVKSQTLQKEMQSVRLELEIALQSKAQEATKIEGICFLFISANKLLSIDRLISCNKKLTRRSRPPCRRSGIFEGGAGGYKEGPER